MQRHQLLETRRLAKCFINFIGNHRDQVVPLFELLSVVRHKTRCDYTCVKDFYVDVVADQYTVEEKKRVSSRIQCILTQLPCTSCAIWRAALHIWLAALHIWPAALHIWLAALHIWLAAEKEHEILQCCCLQKAAGTADHASEAHFLSAKFFMCFVSLLRQHRSLLALFLFLGHDSCLLLSEISQPGKLTSSLPLLPYTKVASTGAGMLHQ